MLWHQFLYLIYSQVYATCETVLVYLSSISRFLFWSQYSVLGIFYCFDSVPGRASQKSKPLRSLMCAYSGSIQYCSPTFLISKTHWRSRNSGVISLVRIVRKDDPRGCPGSKRGQPVGMNKKRKCMCVERATFRVGFVSRPAFSTQAWRLCLRQACLSLTRLYWNIQVLLWYLSSCSRTRFCTCRAWKTCLSWRFQLASSIHFSDNFLSCYPARDL